MSYKVLVCGSRDYSDRAQVYHVLDALYAKVGDKLMIISGGARGADELAREWAVDRKVDHLTLYAKWDRFGRAAGPLRNRRMAKRNPRLVYAFHTDISKSKGTKDMVKVAGERNIKWKVFK